MSSEIRLISENDRPIRRHSWDLLHGGRAAAEDRGSGAGREAGGARAGGQGRLQWQPEAGPRQEHAAL